MKRKKKRTNVFYKEIVVIVGGVSTSVSILAFFYYLNVKLHDSWFKYTVYI